MKLIAFVFGLFFVAGNAMAAVKTCQTPHEISFHLGYDATLGEFCFHKVVDPTVSLTGKAIPSFNQLKPNLEVAFLNSKAEFTRAQEDCASLGADWHAPASSNYNAVPRALDNSDSIEAMIEYFQESTGEGFWSSSTVSVPRLTYNAWQFDFMLGAINMRDKNTPATIVCVKS